MQKVILVSFSVLLITLVLSESFGQTEAHHDNQEDHDNPKKLSQQLLNKLSEYSM